MIEDIKFPPIINGREALAKSLRETAEPELLLPPIMTRDNLLESIPTKEDVDYPDMNPDKMSGY